MAQQRFQGTLTTWNDDRGFGFLAPVQGGDDVFVHINAFDTGAGRPQVGWRVAFDIDVGPEGKRRARNVEPLGGARSGRPAAVRRKGRRFSATLLFVPLFAGLYAWAHLAWNVPTAVGFAYVALTVATYAAYAMDKAAARSNRWRISEKTLHLMALAGGWPGALIARQALRHKSVKAGFQGIFWLTVGLNIAGFLLLCSPAGQSLLPR